MRTQRLLFALLALGLLSLSAHAESTNVLDPASFDCTDPEVLSAAENQSLPSDTLGVTFLSDPVARPLSGSNCHREGSGALGYCTGGCPKVGTSCVEVITSQGFTCGCKAKVITQP